MKDLSSCAKKLMIWLRKMNRWRRQTQNWKLTVKAWSKVLPRSKRSWHNLPSTSKQLIRFVFSVKTSSQNYRKIMLYFRVHIKSVIVWWELLNQDMKMKRKNWLSLSGMSVVWKFRKRRLTNRVKYSGNKCSTR